MDENLTVYCGNGILDQISAYDKYIMPIQLEADHSLKEILNNKEGLKAQLEVAIKIIDDLVEQIKANDLQNEQWALDGLDKLNEISVRY